MHLLCWLVMGFQLPVSPGNTDQVKTFGHLCLSNVLTAADLPGLSGQWQPCCHRDKLASR